MFREHRQYIVDRRETRYNVQDFQVRTAKDRGQNVNPKAGQNKMKTSKNHEEQRNYMNQFHNTNLTLSVGLYPQLLYSKNSSKNPQET